MPRKTPRTAPDKLAILPDLPAELLETYRRAGKVGVDLEMTGLSLVRDMICLVQLCDEAGNGCFVRPGAERPERLIALLTDAAVQKIFHFAVVDCAFLLYNLGVIVTNPYCTKIASRLARTYTDKHGLKDLVLDVCGVELDKESQTTDWCGALNDKQRLYALNDVLYLIEIQRGLERMLERRGILRSGISAIELNHQCQLFLPTLVQLCVNEWNSPWNREGRWSTDVFEH